MQRKFQQSKSVVWKCLRFYSSSECWTFLLCRRDRYAQCKLCSWFIPQVQFLEIVDMPVVVLDKCMIQTVQKTAVPQFRVDAVPVVVQRQVPGLVLTVLKTVEIPQLSTE